MAAKRAAKKKESVWPAGEVAAARAARRTMTHAEFRERYEQSPIPSDEQRQVRSVTGRAAHDKPNPPADSPFFESSAQRIKRLAAVEAYFSKWADVDRMRLLASKKVREWTREDFQFQIDFYAALAKRLKPAKQKPRKPTVIHVNQLVIRSNAKHERNDPPLTVRVGRKGQKAKRAHTVTINGPSKLVHSPHKPLPCGARVWIETFAKVTTK